MNENCRYRNLALDIINEATAEGVTPFRRLQLLGELGGVVTMLSDRSDWLTSQWEATTAELAALKAAKVGP